MMVDSSAAKAEFPKKTSLVISFEMTRDVSLSKNTSSHATRTGVLAALKRKTARKSQKSERFHFQTASFLRFMAAYLSLTQAETRARPRWWARRKILCKRFSTKSRMGLESRADFGLNPLVTESHGGQNGMRAGTA